MARGRRGWRESQRGEGPSGVEEFVGLLLGFAADVGCEVAVEGAEGHHECGEVVGEAEGGDEVGHEVGREDEVAEGSDDEGFGPGGDGLLLQEEIELECGVEHFGSDFGCRAAQFFPEGVVVVVAFELRCVVDAELFHMGDNGGRGVDIVWKMRKGGVWDGVGRSG